MNETSIFQADSYVYVALALCFCVFVVLWTQKVLYKAFTERLSEAERKIRQEILSSVQTKFLDISLSANDLIDLSVEVWRLENKYRPVIDSLDENAKRGIENTISKIKRYLDKNDFEVVDFTNQKFSDGLNVEIISVEEDESVDTPIVKETVEPTVMCRGQVVKKAKVLRFQ